MSWPASFCEWQTMPLCCDFRVNWWGSHLWFVVHLSFKFLQGKVFIIRIWNTSLVGSSLNLCLGYYLFVSSHLFHHIDYHRPNHWPNSVTLCLSLCITFVIFCYSPLDSMLNRGPQSSRVNNPLKGILISNRNTHCNFNFYAD